MSLDQVLLQLVVAICSKFGSSHIGLFIQKIKETGSGFHISANETS